MASRWGKSGKKVETRTDFLGLQNTADGDYRHEIKRWLLLGRKAITNLDSVLKSIDSTLLTKVCIVNATVFPVVMYGGENWPWRIDAFELRCWRRLLRVPWTARRPNQSILKESNPEYSLEGLMVKLKLQYFGHLIQRTNSLENTLMLGKIEGKRRKGWQRMKWLDSITGLTGHEAEQTLGDTQEQRRLECHRKSQTQHSDWTTATITGCFPPFYLYHNELLLFLKIQKRITSYLTLRINFDWFIQSCFHSPGE